MHKPAISFYLPSPSRRGVPPTACAICCRWSALPSALLWRPPSAAVRTRFGHLSRLHWRQLALAVEILILFSVSFFPPEHHLAANSLTSLACGIQVQAFRKIEGNGIATTMCIGNLRAGVQALHEYHIAHDREELRRGALYFAVIIFFALGAVAGNLLVFRYGLLAIRWDCLLLLLPLLLMLQKPDEAKKETL